MNIGIQTRIFFTLLLIAFYLQVLPQDNSQIALHPTSNDSITTFASLRYESHSILRRLLMGSNYRQAWSQPVKFPVFHLSGSGFTIKELGGGLQTTSLQLLDATGKQWSLRSVEKEVMKAMPKPLKNTLAQKLSQDQVSASFPYGATIASGLAAAIGIKAPHPEFFFVADDTAFGEYRSIFANILCTLQERDGGVDTTVSSRQLLTLMQKENRHVIDQEALLKARLLDLLISDWDRHEDNWRWQVKEVGNNFHYIPIPRDRDWAFFRSNGFLPFVVRFTGMQFLVPFKPKSTNLKSLSFKTWLFDRTLLNGLEKAQWQTISQGFVQQVTDSVIIAAVHTLPKEIYAIHGEEFIQIIKSRRNTLSENLVDYYNFLAEEAIINGSAKEELIQVSSSGDTLTVRMYKLENGLAGDKIYERNFLTGETFAITINGFGGADRFEVSENSVSKIRLILNGGEGNNEYHLATGIKTKVNDASKGKHDTR